MVSSSSPKGQLLRSWHLFRLAFTQCGCQRVETCSKLIDGKDWFESVGQCDV